MNSRTLKIAMLLMGRWDAAARWAPIPLRLIVGDPGMLLTVQSSDAARFIDIRPNV